MIALALKLMAAASLVFVPASIAVEWPTKPITMKAVYCTKAESVADFLDDADGHIFDPDDTALRAVVRGQKYSSHCRLSTIGVVFERRVYSIVFTTEGTWEIIRVRVVSVEMSDGTMYFLKKHKKERKIRLYTARQINPIRYISI